MDLALYVIRHTNPLLCYLVVAIVLLLESSGIPIANSTLLLFTGALASLGHLNLVVLTIVAIVGSISGACLAYLIGLQGGRQFLLSISNLLRMNTQRIDKAERWFHRAGARMIFISRVTPYIRPFACFPAGMTRMPFRRFFVAASSGSILWSIGVLSIGWALGRHWKMAYNFMQTYTLPALGMLVLVFLAFFLVKYAIKRHLCSQMEAVPDTKFEVEKQDSRDLLEV